MGYGLLKFNSRNRHPLLNVTVEIDFIFLIDEDVSLLEIVLLTEDNTGFGVAGSGFAALDECVHADNLHFLDFLDLAFDLGFRSLARHHEAVAVVFLRDAGHFLADDGFYDATHCSDFLRVIELFA